MEVYVRSKCTECDGCGLIVNPIWREFNEHDDKVYEKTKEHLTMEECKKWFHQMGHSKLPKEELDCHECEGSGTEECWIDLADFGPMIKYAKRGMR